MLSVAAEVGGEQRIGDPIAVPVMVDHSPVPQSLDRHGRIGISLNRLNEVVRGRRRITVDTAIRLSDLLQTWPQFRMRLQADWDLHEAPERNSS